MTAMQNCTAGTGKKSKSSFWKSLGGYVALLFALVFFSGLLRGAPNGWDALDFTTILGYFGKMGDLGVNYKGSNGFGAQDGFLFAFGIVPGMMLALGVVNVVDHLGGLEAARKLLNPVLKPLMGIPGTSTLALICSLQSTDGGAAMTRELVETGKLTVVASEIDQLKADKVVNLSPKKRGMMRTLLSAALRSFWVSLTAPKAKKERKRKGKRVKASPEKKQTELDAAVRSEIVKAVREIIEQERSSKDSSAPPEEDDFELKRLVSMFKLLREQGYTLRILPGTPEENAPVFDPETETILRPAA